MKRLYLIAFMCVLLAASSAFALVLVCDPQDASIVVKYRLMLNDEVFDAAIENVGETQVRLYHNIDSLENGEYLAFAAAGDAQGDWSEWSLPLTFNVGPPSPPNNFRVSQEQGEAVRISQDGWSVYHVSSEELIAEQRRGIYAIDGDPDTQWHSMWSSTVVKHPHEIQFDLGRVYLLSGFYYLPRQDSSWNGGIKRYTLYVSDKGSDWKAAVSGSLEKTKDEQFVEFPPLLARYVSLVALSEVNGGEWTVVAEFNLLGKRY